MTLENLQILQADHHRNGVSGQPFMVALVDDPSEGDVKLVIMFKEPGHTAVLSLDKLTQSEDISFGSNSWRGDRYEGELREQLWEGEEND
jgi:hypothetical protein